MKVEAYAKINLFLQTGEREPNGRHAMDMIMQTVELSDTLTLAKSRELLIDVSGAELPRGPGNLVYDAAAAFFETTGIRCRASILLEKRIPVMAGLGGGSADCAAALIGLNTLYGRPLTEHYLLALAAELGSDVPFFLKGGCACVGGTGEIIEPIINAMNCVYLILKPEGGVSTGAAFADIDRHGAPVSEHSRRCRAAVMHGDTAAFARLTGNSLEPSALRLCPQTGPLLQHLKKTALCAFITGSGSACVGVYRSRMAARSAQRSAPPAAFSHICRAAREGVVII